MLRRSLTARRDLSKAIPLDSVLREFCNGVIVTTETDSTSSDRQAPDTDAIVGWFLGRFPDDWFIGRPEFLIDRVRDPDQRTVVRAPPR